MKKKKHKLSHKKEKKEESKIRVGCIVNSKFQTTIAYLDDRFTRKLKPGPTSNTIAQLEFFGMKTSL